MDEETRRNAPAYSDAPRETIGARAEFLNGDQTASLRKQSEKSPEQQFFSGRVAQDTPQQPRDDTPAKGGSGERESDGQGQTLTPKQQHNPPLHFIQQHHGESDQPNLSADQKSALAAWERARAPEPPPPSTPDTPAPAPVQHRYRDMEM